MNRWRGNGYFTAKQAKLAFGNFKEGQKHGPWIRYDKNDALDYQEFFDLGV